MQKQIPGRGVFLTPIPGGMALKGWRLKNRLPLIVMACMIWEEMCGSGAAIGINLIITVN